MSLSAMIFGSDSAIHKAINIMGLGLPSLLHKWTTPPQPKLAPQMLGEMQDFKVKEGDARAIVFGIGRTIGGTLMYVSDPKRYMVKTYVGEAGGKGGSKKKKQYQDVEHISRSYAVGICEGEIGAVRRIWKNGKLAFDGRKGSEWGEKNNAAFLKDKEFYLGGYEQLPSPTLQSLLGTDIPAFRGTAYMVVSNEDLTKSNGAVPQYQFEVVRSEGQVLTSRPYVIEQKDGVGSTFNVGVDLIPPPSGTSAAGLSGMTFKASLINTVEYSDHVQPLSEAAGLSDITFKASLITTVAYKDHIQPLSEAAGLTDITFKATLKTQVIDVTIPPESTAGVFNVGVELI